MAEPADSIGRQAWLRHIADQRAFDRELAKILRDAALEAERIIRATIGDESISALVRRAQATASIEAINTTLETMWGKYDPALTQAKIQAIDRAIEAQRLLDNALLDAGVDLNDVARFRTSADAGIDAVRARLVNDIRLSDRVYKAQALSRRWVAREINRGLVLQRSAREIAASVRHLIRPDTPGGVSYAARRLARTEINNAFHTATIAAAANEPWTEGFKWNKSGSHPRRDICDDYAEKDHDGLGAGVFAPKTVPDKPHPQCLCFLTVVTPSSEDIIERIVNGDF